MDIMGKALERQAGGKLQTVLSKMSGKIWKGFLLGAAVTAVIQSSSATTVMVVGFVNSGIMTLKQAVGVIMGSNVGTTVTAWILSLSGLEGDSFLIKFFKPSTLAPLIGIIGILLYMGKSANQASLLRKDIELDIRSIPVIRAMKPSIIVPIPFFFSDLPM